MRPKRFRALRPSVDRLDDRCLLSTLPQGLSPAQLQAAYGLNNLTFNDGGIAVPANGLSETIAIIEVDHDPYVYSDLAAFDTTYGLATPTYGAGSGRPWLSQVNLAGNTTDSGWAQEETLDVEWAHAMAPGANLVVIEAASDTTTDLLNAIQVARTTPGVGIVSMSWGISEFPGESVDDVYFTTPPNHFAMTFIAASGDTPGTEWPAASPYVLAVGGTTLNTSSSGAYAGESAWVSSGGGFSQYEAEPAYQYGVQSTGLRSVPDVAFDGDPNTGVAVYTTDPTTGKGSWSVFGGTSLGAPAWAGIVAIIDEGYALAHIVGSMDGYYQTLPILYTRPSSIFNSVASTSSRHHGSTTPLTTTGLGTPDGTTFLNSMLGFHMPAFNAATPSLAHAALQAAAPPVVQGIPRAAATTAVAPAITPALASPVGLGQGGGGSSAGSWTILVGSPPPVETPAPAPSESTPSSPPSSVGSAIPPSPASGPGASFTIDAIPLAAPADVTGSPAPATFDEVSRPGVTWDVVGSIVAPGLATPLPLQNAPRVFEGIDEALRTWEDED